MSKSFEIDFKKLVVLLLPTFMRKPLVFGFAKSAVKPITTLYNLFLSNRSQNIYKVNQTGQVCYLRGLLNDNFDFDLRRIYLSDGIASDWVFTFKESTFNVVDKGVALIAKDSDSVTKDSLGNKVITYTESIPLVTKQGSVRASGYDFTIMVPSALRGLDESRLTALVNYYKLASKRYNINYY